MKNLIKNILGNKGILYRVDFAKCFGGVQAGLFLSQLFYWCDKGSDLEGWIYKTQKTLQNETGMTRNEQDTARNKLKKHNVIFEKLKGSPPKIYYKLNMDEIIKQLQLFYSNTDSNCGITANQIDGSQQIKLMDHSKFSITENTSENTSENKQQAAKVKFLSVEFVTLPSGLITKPSQKVLWYYMQSIFIENFNKLTEKNLGIFSAWSNKERSQSSNIKKKLDGLFKTETEKINEFTERADVLFRLCRKDNGYYYKFLPSIMSNSWDSLIMTDGLETDSEREIRFDEIYKNKKHERWI